MLDYFFYFALLATLLNDKMQLPYFYEPSITAGMKQFILSDDTARHAMQVLRMREGECLQLADGKGLLLTAEIETADKKNCAVQIAAQKFIPQESKNICLAISPTKNNARLEWLIEKVTEIGIRKIILLNCERTEKTNIKMERLHRISVAAMLQSEQAYLPELAGMTAFDEIVSHNDYEEKLIAHCANDDNKMAVKNFSSDKSTIILIGPEGDFSNREIGAARQRAFRSVTLGNTRLRTETAGMVAVTLLNI